MSKAILITFYQHYTVYQVKRNVSVNHVYIMINNLDAFCLHLFSFKKTAIVSFFFLFQFSPNVSPTILTVHFLYAVYLWKIVRRLHIKCL